MKLSFYLFREAVTDFDEVIQPKYLDGDDAFVELPPVDVLPYECKAFVQSNKGKQPRWLPFLSGHFDTGGLELLNQSNSFVLVLKAGGRMFAVTFGYGFQALDRAKIEPRFGLIIAASTLDPDHEEIRTLETNLIDTVTRNRRTHISTGSSVAEFDINPHVDWIRKLSGTPTDNDLARFVSGADSVCLGVDCDLESLGAKCNQLLDIFTSEAYKESFRFLDYLQPIGKQDPRIAELEAALAERLAARSHDRIAIAFDELPDENLLSYFKVSSNRRAVELDELGLGGIYQLLEELNVASDPAAIYVVGIGDHGEPVTKRRSLREHLVCEIDLGDDTFIFCFGNWFLAERDYVQGIRDQIASLQDISVELDLPPLQNKEPEGEYNIRVAEDKDWLRMDRGSFQIGNRHDKVEVCDILTKERQMISVKKMEKSSTLSHLFAQGSVSATLLRASDAYRQRFNELAQDHWPDFPILDQANLGSITIVYAIATRKEGSFAESMFFFSMVNLLNHARALRIVGCKLALCKIGYVEDPPPPRQARRKAKPAPNNAAIDA